MKKKRKKISPTKRARIIVQSVFLAVFLFLLMRTEYHGRDIIAFPVKVFLELDPLIMLTTLLASHTLAAGMLLSLIVIVLTVFLGRVFCGWLCPFGALHDAVGYFKRIKKAKPETRLDIIGVKAKYYILVIVLVAALFQIHYVGILDPISLTIRSFAVAVSPALNYLVHGFFDLLYNLDNDAVFDAAEPVHEFLKLHIISFGQPVFLQGSFIGLLFLGLLALNFVRKRFWCRFLCPLGALLGLLSRFSFLRHRVDMETCTECNLCLATCPSGAQPYPEDRWRGAECVMCMNCESKCPVGSVSYQFGAPNPKQHQTDLKRRYLLGASAAGLGSLALFRLNPVQAKGNHELIRPPGSVEEAEFLRRCVKCGECMKVCIGNALHPTFLQAGFEGIWSPILIPSIGYCEFNCTLCGQVCPTDAIEHLKLEEKQKRKIGLAFIDVNRCLPYAFDMNCIVCEEHCPTSPKAILFKTEKVAAPAGHGEAAAGPEDEAAGGQPAGKELKLPVVDPNVCIGCGICEKMCPVGEKAAIRVSSIGEDRSEKNRLIL